MSVLRHCQRCAKPAAEVDPNCDHAGMPHCIAPDVRSEMEMESLRQQLRGAVEERDEAVALLCKAAHRLVPVPPYDEIRAWLDAHDRLGGQQP